MAGILLLTAVNSYAFWIWSPKTKRWLNPQSASYISPDLQLKGALNYFNSHKYKLALGKFRGLIKRYPDARQAAQAQYYVGRCFENLRQPYRAFEAYNKLISTYPNSKKIQTALAAEFAIGKSFLSWKAKRILGMPLTLMEDHPAVEIFKKIVATSPYSKYAPKSLYNLGVFFIKRARYEEAKSALEKLIDNYPESALVDKARYELAMSSSHASLNEDYDQSGTIQARQDLEEFLQDNNSAGVAKRASQQLNIIKEKEAKKNFDTALFYERQDRFSSALIYYHIVVNNYPGTSFAKLAHSKIKTLKEVAE